MIISFHLGWFSTSMIMGENVITFKQEKHTRALGVFNCPFSAHIRNARHIPRPRIIAVSTRNAVVLRIALRLLSRWRGSPWVPRVCPLATESRWDSDSESWPGTCSAVSLENLTAPSHLLTWNTQLCLRARVSFFRSFTHMKVNGFSFHHFDGSILFLLVTATGIVSHGLKQVAPGPFPRNFLVRKGTSRF